MDLSLRSTRTYGNCKSPVKIASASPPRTESRKGLLHPNRPRGPRSGTHIHIPRSILSDACGCNFMSVGDVLVLMVSYGIITGNFSPFNSYRMNVLKPSQWRRSRLSM